MLLIKLFHISRSERKPRETNLGAESFCHGSCRSIAGKAGAAAAALLKFVSVSVEALEGNWICAAKPHQILIKDKLKMMAKKLRGRPAMMINLLN